MAPVNIVSCLLLIIGVFHNIMGSNSTVSRSGSPEIINGRQNVKIAMTRYKDVYDCIDFYEQPAFKHPRLKYHKFHPNIRPNLIPNITLRRNGANVLKFSVFENGGCPTGTVPIRRSSKEVPSQSANSSKYNISSQINNGQTFPPPGTHFAIIQTNSNSNPPHYYGVGAYMSIWNPQVKENQYSASQITIRNGPESLQVGWMVNPTIYKDTRTHMFIHTSDGQSNCYNTFCPGFVIVRSDFPPDLPMSGYSKPGKLPIFANFFIYRESTYGNWWLLVTRKLIPIGFWPGRIFSSLNKFGTYISCGGETYSPTGQSGGYPPMGSGAYPLDMSDQDAFANHFETANEKLQAIDVVDTEKFLDTKKYDVHDLGISEGVGHVVTFGGYGG